MAEKAQNFSAAIHVWHDVDSRSGKLSTILTVNVPLDSGMPEMRNKGDVWPTFEKLEDIAALVTKGSLLAGILEAILDPDVMHEHEIEKVVVSRHCVRVVFTDRLKVYHDRVPVELTCKVIRQKYELEALVRKADLWLCY